MTFVISKIDECVKSSQDTLKDTCRTYMTQISLLAKFKICEVQPDPKLPPMIDISEKYCNVTRYLREFVLKDDFKYFKLNQKLEFDKIFYTILMIKFREIELPRLSEICEQISIESSAHIDPVIAIRLKWRIQSLGIISTIFDRWFLLKRVRKAIIALHDDRLLNDIDCNIHEVDALNAKLVSDPKPDTNGMILRDTRFDMKASRIDATIYCDQYRDSNNFICSTAADFLNHPFFKKIVVVLAEYINFFLQVINYPLERIINSKLLLCQMFDNKLQKRWQDCCYKDYDEFQDEEFEDEPEDEFEDQDDIPTYAERIRRERIHAEYIHTKCIRAEECVRTKHIRLNNFMVMFGAAVMFIQKSDSMSVDDFFEAIISGQIKIAVDDHETDVHEELSVDAPETMIANQTTEIELEGDGKDSTAEIQPESDSNSIVKDDHKNDVPEQKDDALQQNAFDEPESDSDKSKSENSDAIATADCKTDALKRSAATQSQSGINDQITADKSESNSNDAATKPQSENAIDKPESDDSNSIIKDDHKNDVLKQKGDVLEQNTFDEPESDNSIPIATIQSENDNNDLKLVTSILIISTIFFICSSFCLTTGVLIAENIFTICKLCFELKPVLSIFVPMTILSITLAILTNSYRIEITNAKRIEVQKASRETDVDTLTHNHDKEPNQTKIEYIPQ
jgi:hypothetical protein